MKARAAEQKRSCFIVLLPVWKGRPYTGFVFINLLLLSCAHNLTQSPDCMQHISPERFRMTVDLMRKAEEIDPLQQDDFLSKQAMSWASYNSRQTSIVHHDQDGLGPLERLKKAGFRKRLVSENIAAIPASATEADIFSLWKGKIEEQNLMNPLYRNAGFGLAPFRHGCVFVVLLTE